jgi:putative sterol carrier protein
MSDQASGIDPESLSAEDFARLVGQAEDGQIEQVIRGMGTQAVLERVFDGFRDRFKADAARGVTVDVQFVVTDQGEEHPFVVSIRDGTCEPRSGRVNDPKTTLTTGLVPFVRLVAGQANGVELFMTGRLKVAGDMLFAPQIMGYFEPVRA